MRWAKRPHPHGPGPSAEEYNALKRKYDGQPMDAYREAKQAFIQAALA